LSTSKLELCINIAQLLTESGPQTTEQLKARLEINSNLLHRQLKFLVLQNVIKIENTGPSIAYRIASRGIKILEFFKVLPSRFEGIEAST